MSELPKEGCHQGHVPQVPQPCVKCVERLSSARPEAEHVTRSDTCVTCTSSSRSIFMRSHYDPRIQGVSIVSLHHVWHWNTDQQVKNTWGLDLGEAVRHSSRQTRENRSGCVSCRGSCRCCIHLDCTTTTSRVPLVDLCGPQLEDRKQCPQHVPTRKQDRM